MKFEILEKTQAKLIVKCNGKIYESESRTRSCRRVYIFKTFVVKFDKRDTLAPQNRDELNNWAKIYDLDRKYFAKILHHGKHKGKLYIVQQRIRGTETVKPKAMQTFNYLKTKYDFLSDVSCEIGEYSGDAWMFNCLINRKGDLKIYDYAR